MEPPYFHAGEFLRIHRERAKLSQSEFAERLGMRQSKLSNLESREDVLTSTFVRYLAALGYEPAVRTVRRT